MKLKIKDYHKVRFNLSKGVNYMKWKVEYPNNVVEYYSPDDVQLIMYDCIVKNNPRTAKKIFNGENKQVCSWILCEKIIINDSITLNNTENRLSYNPRVTPNWGYGDKNVDNESFVELYTINNKVYFSH